MSSFGPVLAFLVLLCLPAATIEGQTNGAGRRLLWNSRLSEHLTEPANWVALKRHDTLSLSFSPDGQRLAIALSHNQVDPGRHFSARSHVLVVNVSSPDNNVRQFDFQQRCDASPEWNQHSDALSMCGAVIHLAEGTTCHIANSNENLAVWVPNYLLHYPTIWLNADHVVREDGAIFNLNCEQTGTWNAGVKWRIEEVVSTKGWVVLSHSSKNCVRQYAIVVSVSHQTLTRWPTNAKSLCYDSAVVAVGAGALCFNSYDPVNRQRQSVACKAVKEGAEISLPKQLRNFRLTQSAISVPRVVIEKWQPDHDPWWTWLFLPLTWWIPIPGYPTLPQRRLVLDLHSGEVISSWKPRIQNSTSPSLEDWP